MKTLTIQDRVIGPDQPVLVIAEIGVNHDGSLARAQELVRHAAEAGADAVKFQLFQADALMHPSATYAEYQKGRCDDSDPAAMLRRYQLPPLEVAHLAELVRGMGMIPLATPFSIDDVDLIEHLAFPAVKVASPDLNNLLLLQHQKRLGRPMIVSTGAATMAEVARSVAWLLESGVAFALLHCVSAYPVGPEDAHLSWIRDLHEAFGVPVGYSDHTIEVQSGALAVAMGACIVEKHLTYDTSAQGPDHSASCDPQQFKEYVRLVRLAKRMRGHGGKRVLDVERDVRSVSRQSLVLGRDLSPGETIRESDLKAQRPGVGILVADLRRAVGLRVRRRIKSGTLLQWDMLTDAA